MAHKPVTSLLLGFGQQHFSTKTKSFRPSMPVVQGTECFKIVSKKELPAGQSSPGVSLQNQSGPA